MKKTILIAPFGGALAAGLAENLAAESAAAGWSPALARSASSPAPPDPEAGAPENLLGGLAWTPSSYLSTGALLLAVRNALGELDAAVLIVDAGAPLPDLLDAAPGALSAGLQDALLGPPLLARELLRRFALRRRGRLLLVAAEPAEGPPLGPAAATAAGAFRGLGEGLFAAARESSWDCLGLLDRSGKPEPAARHCLRLLESERSSKPGRWLAFSGKPGLFQSR